MGDWLQIEPLIGELMDVVKPLQNKDAPDSAISTAIETMTQKAKEAWVSKNDFLWEAWGAILDLAADTDPADQGRLVEFMAELRKKEVRDDAGVLMKVEGEEVWKDLPHFGRVARSRWNAEALLSDAPKEVQTKGYNMCGFLARLTALSNDPSESGKRDPLDFSLYALWAMRSAHEEAFSEIWDSAAVVRCAAVWLRYVGSKLWKLSIEERQFEGNMAVPGGRFHELSWKGFSKGRWEVWKDGFKEAKQRGEEDEVGDAVELMGKIENQGGRRFKDEE